MTGAHGFIGSHLIKRLGACDAVRHQDILTHDFRGYDAYYFLSAYGNMAGQIGGDEIWCANVADLQTVMAQVDWSKQPTFVYFSSSSVNLSVQTAYSYSKYQAEYILKDYPALVIRPYSVTGVGEQSAHLIPKLIDSCMNGTRMKFVPDPVHDFVDVDDLCDEVVRLVNAGIYGVHEIGSGKAYSNRDVRFLVELVTGRRANLEFVPSLRPYDNLNWVCRTPIEKHKPLERSIFEMVEEHESVRA